MNEIIFTGLIWLVMSGLFAYSFHKDRSRYRNCNLLFLALVSLIPFTIALSGTNRYRVIAMIGTVIFITLLIIPFFLIHNGRVMIRREGRRLAHMLSLVLGILILIGEIATFAWVLIYSYGDPAMIPETSRLLVRRIIAFISISVIYGSMAFLIFMIYSVFLQIIPRKRDFDYVIILGAGLIEGNRLSRLLKDRLDKAVEVYRRDPTPPVLIPSGGQGDDETVSEAAAMKQYLLERGIPEKDILLEDQSENTFENLRNSKKILDGIEGRKYTALVTGNYHVYRALRNCRKIGLKCTGIGSRVALYFWPSALIREFIAIHTEPKHAFLYGIGWLFWLAVGFRLFELI